MNVPRVDLDPETRYAYVALADIAIGGVKYSVPLQRRDADEPEALDAIVLDFDIDGRLVS